MSLFAIIKTGGKQYLVKEADVLRIEKIDQETGTSLQFEPLLVASEEPSTVAVGLPLVKNASVIAKILEHGRGKKVSIIKYKPKSRYRRHTGHRQPFTKIQIEKIVQS